MRNVTRSYDSSEEAYISSRFDITLYRSLGECINDIVTATDRSYEISTNHELPLCIYGHNRAKWMGVRDRRDLIDSVRMGIDGDLTKAIADELKGARVGEELRPVRRGWDVAGGSLSVPRMLAGDPMCFRHRRRGQAPSRSVEILILPTIAAHTSAEMADRIGICIGRCIGRIRGAGYSVGISALSLAMVTAKASNVDVDRFGNSHLHVQGMGVRIKAPSSVLNPRILAMTLSRVFSRGLFISYLSTHTDYLHTNRWVMERSLDNQMFDVIDDLFPNAKVIFDSDDICMRMETGWTDDRITDYLCATVLDHHL